jgi:inhibitor of KinA
VDLKASDGIVDGDRSAEGAKPAVDSATDRRRLNIAGAERTGVGSITTDDTAADLHGANVRLCCDQGRADTGFSRLCAKVTAHDDMLNAVINEDICRALSAPAGNIMTNAECADLAADVHGTGTWLFAADNGAHDRDAPDIAGVLSLGDHNLSAEDISLDQNLRHGTGDGAGQIRGAGTGAEASEALQGEALKRGRARAGVTADDPAEIAVDAYFAQVIGTAIDLADIHEAIATFVAARRNNFKVGIGKGGIGEVDHRNLISANDDIASELEAALVNSDSDFVPIDVCQNQRRRGNASFKRLHHFAVIAVPAELANSRIRGAGAGFPVRRIIPPPSPLFAIFPTMEITPLGDSALNVRVCNGFNENPASALESVLDALRRLEDAQLPGVIELAPAYTSVAVFFDPVCVIEASGTASAANDSLAEKIREVLAGKVNPDAVVVAEPRLVTIPVCYGGELGPDIDEVARLTGFSPDEIIKRHTTAEYRVHCIGFSPGFPYLGGLPPELATPRRATPRKSVPAGSVGIGGAQTGVYPLPSPGGWHLIGRTPSRLFAIETDPPTLLRAGDLVRFQSITRVEFDAWTE